jgi:hypothetical protein
MLNYVGFALKSECILPLATVIETSYVHRADSSNIAVPNRASTDEKIRLLGGLAGWLLLLFLLCPLLEKPNFYDGSVLRPRYVILIRAEKGEQELV